MPRKVVTTQHIYEVSFRITSNEKLHQHTIEQQIGARLANIAAVECGPVNVRELCFDEYGGDSCCLTEGHRGLHNGFSGGRWGNDL